MPKNLYIVALLREFAGEGSITRPEVARLFGKKPNTIAGICDRNKHIIGSWPKKLRPDRRANRRCQWPIGTPGTKGFRLCGKKRKDDPLLCPAHKGKTVLTE